jgi:hypothetical protein
VSKHQSTSYVSFGLEYERDPQSDYRNKVAL